MGMWVWAGVRGCVRVVQCGRGRGRVCGCVGAQKLTAELELPLETFHKTTCEFTSVKNRRVCIPSCVTRLRRLIGLSASKTLICMASEKRQESIVAQSGSKASGAAVAQPS